MKIYKLLLSLMIPFYSFGSEINSSDSKEEIVSINYEETQKNESEIKVENIESINKEEAEALLIKYYNFLDFNKVIEIIESLMPFFNININPIVDGLSLLHIACFNGNLKIVKYLIENCNADIAALTRDNETILHIACFAGNLEVVKYLIDDCKADIKAQNNGKATSLHIACFAGNLEVVRYLIDDCKADIKAVACKNYTPLHIACQEGHVGVVKYLIGDCKADIEAMSDENYTPLHIACENGHVGVVKCLIDDYKANIMAIADENYTLLHIACKCDQVEVAKYLIDHCKADTMAIADEAGTPLHLACKYGSLEAVKYLIFKDLKLSSITNQYNRYPLDFIAEFKHLEQLVYFIEKENLKSHIKLELKPEYLNNWLESGCEMVSVLLLQQGIDHGFGNSIFEQFSGLFKLENIDEGSSLFKFNLIKEKLKDLIISSNWEEILRIKALAPDLVTECNSENKKNKRFISIFFSPCQIFQLIYNQYKSISISYQEIEKLIKIVAMEYDLNQVTNENNMNLLHLFSSEIGIRNYLIPISPSLMIMKDDKGRRPCLDAFYISVLSS